MYLGAMTVEREPRPRRSRTRYATVSLSAVTLVLAITGAPALTEDGPVPAVRAPDLEGKIRTLADFPGRVTLLLFWQPDIERSRQALCSIAELAAAYEPGALATVVPGPHEQTEIKQALGACRRQPAVLLDPDRKISAAFQVIAQPTVILVGPDGRLQYKVAGFSSEGVGAVQVRLDEIYGRRKTPAAAPVGTAQEVRRYGLAQQLLRVGMTAQAESILQSLTAEHPDFRPAWVALGYRKIAAGEADEAKACFEKALALDPQPTDVAAGLAWVWWKKGDAAQSAKWAAAVDRKDPNYGLIAEIRKKTGPGGEE